MRPPEDDGDATRAATAAHDLRIGDWTFSPETGRLRRGGEVRHLGPRQAELLRYLTARAGEVVSKDEVLDVVWAGNIVEEGAVHRCISEIRKALGDHAREPAYVLTVPKRGYLLLAEVSADPEPPRPGPDSGRKPLRWIAVAGLVAILALGWWLSPWRQSGALYRQTDSGGDRPSIAVLEFRNTREGTGAEWLATAVPEMLATELSAATDLHVIPSEAVARLQSELSVRTATGFPTATVRLARSRLGADYVVSGTISALGAEAGDSIRLDVRVVRTSSAEEIGVFAENGATSELFEVAKRAGTRVLAILGSTSVAGRQALVLAPDLPRDGAAARLYFEGLRQLRRFDSRSARDLLERSLEHAPDQPFALLALSRAQLDLGDLAGAEAAAARALELSGDLPREHRLWFEAVHLAATSEWEQAIDRYRALHLFSPRNQEYALLLAEAQNRAGRHQAALETAERIREEGAEDPRIDLLLAESAASRGEHERALAAAQAAERLAHELEAERAVSAAKLLQGEALYALGRVDEAFAVMAGAREQMAAAQDRRGEARVLHTLAKWQEDVGEFAASRAGLTEALAIFQALGDRGGEAEILAVQAFQAHDAGEGERAAELFERALGVFRDTGNRPQEAALLGRWGTTRAIDGDHVAARARYSSALALYRDLGNREMEAMILMNLGRVALFSGDTTTAEGHLRAAETLLRDGGSPGRLALVRYNLGFLHFENGYLEPAREAFTESELIFTEVGNDRMRATSLEFLGVILTGQGDLFQARVRQERALAMRREMGNPPRLVKSLCFSADLALAEGDLATAEAMAREALEVSRGQPELEAEPRLLLADLLTAQGRTAEARASLARARSHLGVPEALDDGEQQVLLIEARLLQALGDLDQARALVDKVLAESRSGGSWVTHAEALLLSGKIELDAGDRAKGEDRLQRLAQQAADRGWVLFERRAREALDRGSPAS